MQQRNSQTIDTPKQEQQKRYSLQQQAQDDQITPETVQRFNKICLQATQLMNNYKYQSIALKQEIADMVSIYQKSSTHTDVVPVEKIISITNEYEQGMRQANKEYGQLAEELRQQEKQRDEMMLQIKDCFEKLQRMEVKMKEKKRRQLEQKQQKLTEQKLAELKVEQTDESDKPKQAETKN